MTRKLFLLESQSVSVQLAELFDFVWPTVTALKYLRGRISARIEAMPSIGEFDLGAEFGAVRGARLRHAFHSTSADDHEQHLARFLLFSICALYEGWADGVADRLVPLAAAHQIALPKKIADNLGKNLQHTDGDDRPPEGLRLLCATRSDVMAQCIYPELASNKKYAEAALVPLLKCYRHFKNVRNCLIHAGGIADSRVEQGFLCYEAISAAELGVKEVPECAVMRVGDSIRLSLRGVVGLGDIVLRLVVAIDTELSRSALAETIVLDRLRTTRGIRIALPSNPAKAHRRVASLGRAAHLPAIHAPDVFLKFLKSAGFAA